MKKTIKVILISILCIVVVYVAIFLVASAPGSTKKMVDIANQFKPDSSWQFKSETIHPPRIACLGGHCDEMSRSWTLSDPIETADEFKSFAKLDGREMEIKPSCFVNTYSHAASKTACDATAEKDAYSVTVSYRNYGDTKPEITLNISR